jgi:hypothetical protein
MKRISYKVGGDEMRTDLQEISELFRKIESQLAVCTIQQMA